MSDIINPQAFPTNDVNYPNGQIQYGQEGMTLRDYFAAHAPLTEAKGESWEEHAEERYDYADAMLAESSKRK